MLAIAAVTAALLAVLPSRHVGVDAGGGNTTASDVAALLALYTSAGGSAWLNASGWSLGSSASDPCVGGWFSVECGGTTPNAVTYVPNSNAHWGGLGLTGPYAALVRTVGVWWK